MASTLTQFDAFLKEFYTKQRIANLTYKDRPLFARVKKDPTQSGDLYVHPVIIGNPQGLGATRSYAQTGSTQTTGGNVRATKWTCTYGDYAGSVDVGDKVLRASRNDVGAFMRNQKLEVDGLYEAFGDTFGYYMYADAGRALGSGTDSTGVQTLANANDAANFEVGQILVASANDGTSSGHTLIGAPSLGYVIAVNRNAGTVTVSATSGGAAGTPTSWTGTMYYFRSGDFGGSGTTRIMLGLGAWVPSSDPGATSFEGVTRTTDISRLSGVRLAAADISGLDVEQRVKLLATRMSGRAGSKAPKEFYMHPEVWQQLSDTLENRGVRDLGVRDAQFGYMSLKLATAGGIVDVFADRFCPSGSIFALNLDYIFLGSYDDVPTVVNGDGLSMLRKSSSDDYEHRIVAYPALCVSAPGYQGRVSAP